MTIFLIKDNYNINIELGLAQVVIFLIFPSKV